MNLWTPGGTISTERQTVNLPPEYMKMLAVFGETSSEINLGLHCSRCKQDVVGKNATADKGWIMECACRTFIGRNPIQSH